MKREEREGRQNNEMESKMFDDEYSDPVADIGGSPVDGAQESALRSMKTSHQTLTVLRCKTVFCGDAHVGKTALCQMFHSGGQNYPKSYLMTLGVDFSVKDVPIAESNRKVEMFIYDTGGQSVFNQRELGGQYWSNASVAVYVYDVGSRASFLSCTKWLAAVRSENPGRPLPGILVANKVDLREKGRVQVSREEGQDFARTNGLTFLETSAMRNEGVKELFQFIADAYNAKYDETITKLQDSL